VSLNGTTITVKAPSVVKPTVKVGKEESV